MEEQISKMCCKHTMEYYLAIKKEVLIHATWTNIENRLLK
jgi:hypothetical protein